MKKLYIGNLPYDMNQEGLEKHFSEYGTVSSAVVITDRDTGRSKGFGFVEMENSDEADKAVKEMDGKDLQGRNIRVNEARPKTNNRFREGGGSGRDRNRRRN